MIGSSRTPLNSIAQAHVRDLLLNTFKELPFIQLGPFDLLAWQLL